MLGGDSGRFLCFCLRRSLSFRLWGRRGDQILVLRAFGVNINVIRSYGEWTPLRDRSCGRHPLYGETGGLELDRSGSGKFL